jgi:NADPH:quinone reductase-like Zn-dependent oxidoreductase
MARQPLNLPNGLLIFKDLIMRGFWVSQWYRRAPGSEVLGLLTRLLDWMAEGVLHTPVEAVYSLGELRAALEHAQRGERAGKILLCP